MSFAKRITRAPFPFDATLGQEAAARFGHHPPELQELLVGAAGCSPYLRLQMERHGDWLDGALAEGPETALEAELQALGDGPPREVLRKAKGRLSALIALADLGGVWSLAEVTGGLTRFADAAVDCALQAAVAEQSRRRKLPDGLPRAGGLVALAMGKMGAAELNYSSDVDLICLFDENALGAEAQAARPALIRAVREMAATLSEITADGYVFRTDLRLRPDASVTPVALSMAAAEQYYESVGRTWERAAYIKARPAAGARAAGTAFLERLTPFIWRKHLDFAAIQDAHDMRLRIRSHKGLYGPITLPGHNMKLGRGGIREIEFFTQTRQLIAGGRDPELRLRGTVKGLEALQRKGWIAADVSERLGAAYAAHREVEHRLQMIADAQTHSLPKDEKGFARLAAFMGQSADALRRDLAERLAEVHALTDDFFAPQDAPRAAVQLDDDASAMVKGWSNYPALRSERALQIFERLKPGLLDRLADAEGGVSAPLKQFDLFLSRLPAGVQLFSMFEANPQLVELILDIVSVSPTLASYLGRNAQVLDAVIGGSFSAPWPGMAVLKEALAQVLAGAGDYERQLDAARRWHKEWHFRIGVHHLRGLMDAGEVGVAYADLAEAVLAALLPVVEIEFSRKFGAPPGPGAAVIAMGSLGARQLSATSDLDLIVIYDAGGVERSDGPRPLEARSYYARLTQALVTALSAPTAEGALYEVDMRLRPSGRQGPVATSLSAFDRYQREEAWTWEHLALTRARFVAGREPVGRAAEAIRAAVVTQSRDAAGLLRDVADMRARLAEAAAAVAPPLEAKRGPGRMQDIELLAQAAGVAAADSARTLTEQVRAAETLGWLAPGEAEALVTAHDWLWRLQAAARLVFGRTSGGLGELGQHAAGADFLLSQTHCKDAQALDARLNSVCDVASGIVSRMMQARLPATKT